MLVRTTLFGWKTASPISILNGLPYISLHPPMDKEMESLLHKIMTSPSPWDPAILNHQIDSDDDDFFDALEESDVTIHDHTDEYGCASCWLLVLCYVMFMMNHLTIPALDRDIPLQHLTGNMVDISIILHFPFLAQDLPTYPTDTKNRLCYMVGFSESVGHAMTYKLLTCDTHKITHRSSIHCAEDPSTVNIRAAPTDGDNIKQYIKSKYDTLQKISTVEDELPLLVKGFSIRIHAHVIEIHDDYLVDPTKDKDYLDSLSPQEWEDFLAQHTKFMIQYDKTELKEILMYEQIIDYLHDDQKNEQVWKF
jgi:hypothetical protein